MQSVLERVLPRLQETNSPRYSVTESLCAEIKKFLADWRSTAGASQDCPLPELYRRLEGTRELTIGAFHDVLRRMHHEQQVYLHPWTSPMYTLPEPQFALLVGHEVAFFASIR